MATNQALALCARSVTRDYVDIVELHRIYPLAAIVWAACGKDPGFSPLHLLKMMRRFARIDPAKLTKIQARKIDPQALKRAWIEMSDEADAKITHLADTPIGVGLCGRRGQALLARRHARAHHPPPAYPRLPPARGWAGAGDSAWDLGCGQRPNITLGPCPKATPPAPGRRCVSQ